MKTSILFLLLIIISLSCNSKRDIDKEIKKQIAEFYFTSEVKDYKPESYSKLDTIQNIVDPKGNIIRLTAILTHRFYARSNNGDLNQYTDTFDIVIFKKDVIAIPRNY
jgi:hypothetical protein